MSDTHALSRKDMREPDRFQNVATQAASWLAARKKLIALVGGIAVVAVVAVGVVTSIGTSRDEKAGLALSKLFAMSGAAVGVPTPFGTFETDEAKQKALVAEAEGVLGAHGTTRVTAAALMAKADAHFALKEWDAAQAAYEGFLAAASADDSFRFLALENLGLLAEAKGDLAGAAQAFERMAREAPAYADRADLDRARVLSAAGKADEAKKILSTFSEVHKESVLQGQAAAQAAKLGGQ